MTQGRVTMQDPDFCYRLPPATFQGRDYTFSTSHTGSTFPEMPGRHTVNRFAAVVLPIADGRPGDHQMVSSLSGGR